MNRTVVRRRRRRTVLAAGAAGCLLLIACNGGNGGAADAGAAENVDATADAEATDGPEAVVEQLRTAAQAGDWLTIYDLIYTRTRVDEETVRWRQSGVRARNDYHAAMREAFGDAAAPYLARDPNDALGRLAAALETATLETLSGRKAEVRGADAPGDAPPLVALVKVTGEWRIEPAFLNNGEPLTEPGFFQVQGRYRAQVKYPRDVAAAIRAGEFATADEAAARLQQLMTGPPPPLGSVTPD